MGQSKTYMIVISVSIVSGSYFSEYCIRKKYLNNSDDTFLKFLELITRVYNPSPTTIDWMKKKPEKIQIPSDNTVPIKWPALVDISNHNSSLHDFKL